MRHIVPIEWKRAIVAVTTPLLGPDRCPRFEVSGADACIEMDDRVPDPFLDGGAELGRECVQYRKLDRSCPESKVCVTDGPDRASLIESGSVRGCCLRWTCSFAPSRHPRSRGCFVSRRISRSNGSGTGCTNRCRSTEGGIH